MSAYPPPPPPPSSISVNIQLNYDDYRRAFYEHMGAGRYLWIMFGVAAIALAFSLPAAASNVGLRVGLIAAGIVLLFIFPFSLRKQFKANKKLAQPFSVTASDNGIESSSEYGTSQLKWKTFIRFVEGKYT